MLGGSHAAPTGEGDGDGDADGSGHHVLRSSRGIGGQDDTSPTAKTASSEAAARYETVLVTTRSAVAATRRLR